MSNKKFRFKANDGGAVTSTLTSATNIFFKDQKSVLLFERDSLNDLRLFIDGEQITLGGTTNNDRGFDVANLGIRNDNDRHFEGNIYEIFMYNKVLTEPQRKNAMDYLIYKFSI